MNFGKINIIIISICTIVAILLISKSSLALSENGNYEEEKIHLNNNISFIFNDTSNVSMVDSYPNEEIIKEFSVTNKGDDVEYYDIILDNVINNFVLKDDLVYNLYSENAAYVENKIAPSFDSNIASSIKIDKNQTHKYVFKIKYNENSEGNNANTGKTFSSNIRIIDSNNPNNYLSGTIGNIMSNNAISSFKNIDKSNYGDGIYYTNNSIDGKTVYFYRGSNKLNNNAVLGNNCYKIIRTTEDGGTRLIYNGPYVDSKCSDSVKILDELSDFNKKSNFNSYVGYMYGNPSSNNYESEHKNLNSSSAKIVLDSWYTKNIEKYNNFLSKKTIYCNNRKVSKFKIKNVLYDNIGYGNSITGYELMKNYMENNISYDCEEINDRFSVNSKIGNNILSNSIALITLEELYYAGYDYNISNINNYLYSSVPYWTMSSAYFNGNAAYNFIVNKDRVSVDDVSKKYGIRPVLTMNSFTYVLSGNGSLDKPYILFSLY